MTRRYVTVTKVWKACLFCGDAFFTRPDARYHPRPMLCREYAWRKRKLLNGPSVVSAIPYIVNNASRLADEAARKERGNDN